MNSSTQYENVQTSEVQQTENVRGFQQLGTFQIVKEVEDDTQERDENFQRSLSPTTESRTTSKETSQYRIVAADKSVRPRAHSFVWKYFGLAEKVGDSHSKNSSSDRILCLRCFRNGMVQVYKKSTSSSNLWKHLSKKHGIQVPREKMFALRSGSSLHFNSSLFDSNSRASDFEESTQVILPNFKTEAAEDDPMLFENITIHDAEEIIESFSNDTPEPDQDEDQNNRPTRDIGLMLIEEIAKRPLLYEHQSNKLATKPIRDQLWNEVHSSMGEALPVDRLQKMWKNIRDRYKKIRNSEKDGASFSPKYRYYAQLRFLDSEDNVDNPTEQYTGPVQKKPRNESKIYRQIRKDGLIEEHIVDLPEEDPIDTDESFSSQQQTHRGFEEMPEANNQYINQAKHSCNCSSDNKPDEFEIFGKLIAEKLRQIPSERVNDTELKILQLVMLSSSKT